MMELEETWSPTPVKAWRYFWVGELTWNWGEDRWQVMLSGDIETWDGPVKYAGQHVGPDVSTYMEWVDHQAPFPGCNCGVNAVKNLEAHEIKHRMGLWCECTMGSLVMPPPRQARIIATSEVELAGVVDEYEKGYRAEQATIVGPLTLFGGTEKMASVLVENYGIEVSTDWYSLLAKLEVEEARAKEEANGHRKTDSSDHRGAGTDQGSRAGKGTRHRTLKEIGYALGLPLVWVTGATAMAESDAWWSYAAWFAAVIVGGLGINAHARFLKNKDR